MSNNIIININDLLSEEEQKEIAKDCLRGFIIQDKERLLTNFAYSLGAGFLQDIVTSEQLATIKKTCNKILTDKHTIKYQLYREPELWDPPKNTPTKIMERAIEDNKQILIDKTVEALGNVDVDVLTETISENMDTILVKILETFKSGGKKC